MKMPSSAASMAYSGQCRRESATLTGRSASRVRGISATDGKRRAPPRRALSPLAREHTEVEPERLTYRPGLEGTPARRVRCIGVGNLRDVAQTRHREMLEQRVEESAAGLLLGVVTVAAHPNPRLDEWSQQPGPDRTLVIGPVP